MVYRGTRLPASASEGKRVTILRSFLWLFLLERGRWFQRLGELLQSRTTYGKRVVFGLPCLLSLIVDDRLSLFAERKPRVLHAPLLCLTVSDADGIEPSPHR